MNYPLISEYIEAIKSAEDNFEELSYLRPVLRDDGLPIMTSGNFAVVFKMKDGQSGKFYAVKCFTKEQEGRAEAYREIAKELENVSSPYILSIRYLEKELFVDTDQTTETEFPVLLMDWVEGKTLDKYLRENLDDKYALEMLAYRFSQLAQWLIPQPFAHGDLKPDNILVRFDESLVLVDYDGMYVPSMKGQKARELGSPDFRHPQRNENDFDEHIDDFSFVSILLSLKMLSINPQLLSDFRNSGGLLLSARDYRDIGDSELLKIINSHSTDLELKSLFDLFLSVIVRYKYSFISKPIKLPRPFKAPVINGEEIYVDKYGAIFSPDRKKLLKGINVKSYFVPYGTEVISEKAFKDCYLLRMIIIPETVKVIQKEAFYGCTALRILAPYYNAVNIKTKQGCCEIIDSKIPPLYRSWNEHEKNKSVWVSFKYHDDEMANANRYKVSTLISKIVPNNIEFYSKSPELLIGKNIYCTTYIFSFEQILLGSNHSGKRLLKLFKGPSYTSLSYSFIGNDNTFFQGYNHALTCLYQLMNRHSLFFEFMDKEDPLPEINININRDISVTLFNEELPLIHSSLPVSVTEIGDRAFYHCSYLEWIGVEGCTKFGDDIFDGCISMKKVILPKSRYWMLEGRIPSNITIDDCCNP